MILTALKYLLADTMIDIVFDHLDNITTPVDISHRFDPDWLYEPVILTLTSGRVIVGALTAQGATGFVVTYRSDTDDELTVQHIPFDQIDDIDFFLGDDDE